MNDDLHDIDRLFRNGIEGHEEPPPPLVWEGVSNDLDKKQASYYKRKYQRLKRAAWLFLLLLFTGGLYVVYKASDKKKEPSVKTNPAKTGTTTSSSPDAAAPFVMKGPAKPEEENHQEDKTLPVDTASVLLPKNTAEKREKEKTKGETRISTAANNDVLARNPLIDPSRSIVTQHPGNTIKTKEQRIREEQFFTANKKGRPGNKRSITPNGFASPQQSQPPFTNDPLATKSYNSPDVALGALSVAPPSILPQTPITPKSKAGRQHGFSLSAFAAPNIGFDRLEDNDRLAGPGRNRQEARRQEQDNFSFSAGLLLTYHLSSKWAVQSGIGITSSSTAIAPTNVYAKADNNGHARYELNCSSGYVYIDPKSGVPRVGDTAKTSGTFTKLTYVTVPASVSYGFSKGRISLWPSLGMGLNFLTSGKTKTNLSNAAGSSESTTASISGLKAAYVDGHFGFGIEYNLSKRLALGIRPNARIALTPINKETPVQSYQNYLSVETGVRIKF